MHSSPWSCSPNTSAATGHPSQKGSQSRKGSKGPQVQRRRNADGTWNIYRGSRGPRKRPEQTPEQRETAYQLRLIARSLDQQNEDSKIDLSLAKEAQVSQGDLSGLTHNELRYCIRRSTARRARQGRIELEEAQEVLDNEDLQESDTASNTSDERRKPAHSHISRLWVEQAEAAEPSRSSSYREEASSSKEEAKAKQEKLELKLEAKEEIKKEESSQEVPEEEEYSYYSESEACSAPEAEAGSATAAASSAHSAATEPASTGVSRVEANKRIETALTCLEVSAGALTLRSTPLPPVPPPESPPPDTEPSDSGGELDIESISSYQQGDASPLQREVEELRSPTPGRRERAPTPTRKRAIATPGRSSTEPPPTGRRTPRRGSKRRKIRPPGN